MEDYEKILGGGDCKKLEAYFEKTGVDPNKLSNEELDRGWKPLHFAVMHKDNQKSIAFLIKNGAIVDALNSNGWTALHSAVKK